MATLIPRATELASEYTWIGVKASKIGIEQEIDRADSYAAHQSKSSAILLAAR